MRELSLDQKALAKSIGCAQSTVAEMLAPEAKQSSLVPKVHKVLKWDAPGVPLASPDAGEMSYLFERLPEEVRRLLLEQAREWLKRSR